jgi:tetratricopeptide (TPR) repeat protein
MAKKKSTSNGRSRKHNQDENAADLLRQGTRALHQGKIEEAMQLLERSYELDNSGEDAALNLGGAYILAKKFAQAVAILEPLSEKVPDNPMIWTNLGAAYLGNPVLAKDEDQQNAIIAFKQAIELDPVAPNVAYNLGLIYHDRQDTEEALYWFQRALEANPADQDAQHYIDRLTRADAADD